MKTTYRNTPFLVNKNMVQVGDRQHPITHRFVVKEISVAPAILEYYNTIPPWHPFTDTTWWWDMWGPSFSRPKHQPEPVGRWVDFAFSGNASNVLTARASFFEQALVVSSLTGINLVFELRRTSTPSLTIPIDPGLFLPHEAWTIADWHGRMPITEDTPLPLWSDLWGSDLPTPPVGTRGWSWGGARRTDAPDWGGTGGPGNADYVFWVRDGFSSGASFDAVVNAVFNGPPWLAAGIQFSDALFLPRQRGVRLLSAAFEQRPWERYPALLS